MKTNMLVILMMSACIMLTLGLDLNENTVIPVGESLPNGRLDIVSEKRMVCVVLIDPTLEGGLEGSKKIAQKAYSLTKVLPEGTKIEIYQIDDNPFIPPIASYTKPEAPLSPPSAVRAHPLKLERDAKRIGEAVYLHIQDIQKLTPRSSAKSCIVRSLHTAYEVLRHYPKDQYVWEIIVMSDMLEACENSPVGKLFFTPKGYQGALNKLKRYEPDFDMSYAGLSMIVSSTYQAADPTYIHPDKLNQLWETVFEKIGYSKNEFQHIYFGVSLPPRFSQLSLNKN